MDIDTNQLRNFCYFTVVNHNSCEFIKFKVVFSQTFGIGLERIFSFMIFPLSYLVSNNNI